MSFTFEYQSSLDFLTQKQAELTTSIASKKKIFLDMNHWIRLRNIQHNGPKSAEDQMVFDKILKSTDKCIYPIEFGLLMETTKQADPQSHMRTIDIFDTLSQGVAIIPHNERQFVESVWYFGNPSEVKNPGFIRQYPVFTKAALIAGSKLPVVREYGEEWNHRAQQAFLEHTWGMSLGDMMRSTEFNKDGKASERVPRFTDTADMVNEFNRKHANVFKSWEQLIDIEIQGAADYGKKYFDAAFAYLAFTHTGRWPLPGHVFQHNGMGLHNFVYGLFRRKLASTQFPFLNISAHLYASQRWNKSGKMTGNDHFDFNYATCALPYCDAFATDAKTHFHLTNAKTALDKVYGCHVFTSLVDLIPFIDT